MKLQFHGLKNNAERISLRSGPRSPQVCLLISNRRAEYNCKEYKNWQSWKFPVLGVIFLHFRFWDHISGFARFARFATTIIFGRAKRGDGTAKDGRKTERSSAPYAEAYSPRFCEYIFGLDKFLQKKKKTPY